MKTPRTNLQSEGLPKSSRRSEPAETSGTSGTLPCTQEGCQKWFWALLSTILFVFFPVFAATAAAITPVFDQANQLYEQGKYAEAATVYEKVLGAGQTSPTLYYNLGNAWFKAGQNGRAIAAYRQGLTLAPRDPNLRFNLEFVRKKASGFESKNRPVWQRTLTSLTLNEWTVLATCAYWLLFLLLAVREFRPVLKKSLRPYTMTAGLGTFLLAGCLGAAAYEKAHRIEAVVVVPNAVVRVSPLEDAKVAYQVPDGAELLILDRQERTVEGKKQTWLQVQSSARRTGWVQQDQVVALGISRRSS